ncbi:hypothetical protein MNBD_GAMMA24-152 [hydrothermal vent metagenome]|uniref:Uncharacterized protein n=1 Tax=hydrothermal vent metagenome TaxID=652676 RepID=A0A3B1C6C3_9ZZZZ
MQDEHHLVICKFVLYTIVYMYDNKVCYHEST